jgi:hypothetical protein
MQSLIIVQEGVSAKDDLYRRVARELIPSQMCTRHFLP